MTVEVLKNTFEFPEMAEINQAMSITAMLAQCPAYAKFGQPTIMAIYLKARELNLPFMACLDGGIHVIPTGKDGAVTKLTLAPQMMSLMITRSGHKVVNIDTTSETKCTLHFVRCDRHDDDKSKIYEHTYTIEDAKRANLIKDGWNGQPGTSSWHKYPKDMLYNRCLATGARKQFADVIMNVYIPDEISEDDRNCSVKIDVKPVVQQSIEQKIEEKITDEQYENLISVMGEDKEYLDKLLSFVTNQCGGKTLRDLPRSKFDGIMTKYATILMGSAIDKQECNQKEEHLNGEA